MTEKPRIVALGAGRMGRGIALAFAYAGHRCTLLDIKPRDAASAARLRDEARRDMAATLAGLARVGRGDDRYKAPDIIDRHMREGHTDLRAGKGFFDYTGQDIAALQEDRLKRQVEMLKRLDLLPPPPA